MFDHRAIRTVLEQNGIAFIVIALQVATTKSRFGAILKKTEISHVDIKAIESVKNNIC